MRDKTTLRGRAEEKGKFTLCPKMSCCSSTSHTLSPRHTWLAETHSLGSNKSLFPGTPKPLERALRPVCPSWRTVSGRAGIDNYKAESRNQASKHQAWMRNWIRGQDRDSPHTPLFWWAGKPSQLPPQEGQHEPSVEVGNHRCV